ncbi:hypothetical protein PGT21_009834 [Puccinia graminis f. sp. tritici]|uniref:Uncharacterized protein n=1 Tax=Puccinia graminis f. sp. tritici TaxID=56615 RepID=A0A5B0LJW5_PUCGR|nr:hypothetical protein PGT21_009834 [Puccinia graminis f. sp. tritici]
MDHMHDSEESNCASDISSGLCAPPATPTYCSSLHIHPDRNRQLDEETVNALDEAQIHTDKQTEADPAIDGGPTEEDPNQDGELTAEDTDEESTRHLRDILQSFNDSDSPYFVIPMDRGKVSGPGKMTDRVPELEPIQAALYKLPPQDEKIIEDYLEKMREAYLELANNPHRDRFGDEENAYYFGHLDEVDRAILGMAESNVWLIWGLLLTWATLITTLEDTRARSFKSRRARELVDSLKNANGGDFVSSPGDCVVGTTGRQHREVSECSICLENFARSKRITV